jgi:capsular polysaccharide biosynthesis protein/Mrp family chromosome partitioning ATPase
MSETALNRYASVLRRNAWLVALVVVIALGSAAAVVFTQDPVYRASMQIVVGQAGGDVQPVIGSTPLTQTMSNLLESDVLATSVIQNLGLKTTPEQLIKDLHVSAQPDSAVLQVSYDSTDRQQAAVVLEQVATVYTKLVDQKLGISSGSGGFQGGAAAPSIFATVFDPPHIEPNPISPKTGRTLGFAAVLGLVIGLVLAFVRDSLDDRIRSREDAEQAFGKQVLGVLPKGSIGSVPTAVSGTAEKPDITGAVELLRGRLEYSWAPGGSALVVTSALQEEGKSTVASHLATALAASGKRVICVDADLRRPSLHRYLHLPESGPGLADLIQGTAGLEEILRPVPVSNRRPMARGVQLAAASNGASSDRDEGEFRLHAITAGNPSRSPVAVFVRERLDEVFSELRNAADYVIFDVPPLIVSDSFPLILKADNVIVVAREGKTTREQAHRVGELLANLGATDAGVVLTDAKLAASFRYGYGAVGRRVDVPTGINLGG